MRKITHLFALALFLETSYGRIGETLKECEIRYGKLEKEENNEVTQISFYKAKMDEFLEIGLQFINDKCVGISYFREKGGSPTTREEVISLVQKNLKDQNLKLVDDNNVADVICSMKWQTERGDDALASFDGPKVPSSKLMLFIRTKEVIDENARLDAEKDKAKIENEQKVKDRL